MQWNMPSQQQYFFQCPNLYFFAFLPLGFFSIDKVERRKGNFFYAPTPTPRNHKNVSRTPGTISSLSHNSPRPPAKFPFAGFGDINMLVLIPGPAAVGLAKRFTPTICYKPVGVFSKGGNSYSLDIDQYRTQTYRFIYYLQKNLNSRVKYINYYKGFI